MFESVSTGGTSALVERRLGNAAPDRQPVVTQASCVTEVSRVRVSCSVKCRSMRRFVNIGINAAWHDAKVLS